MKKTLISTSISIIFLLVVSLLTSIAVSILQYNSGVKVNPYLIQFISIVVFLLAGLIFGLINKKQGLIGSLLFILVYLLVVIIFNSIDKTNRYNLYFMFIIIKCISYMIGSILGVNIRKH